MSDNSTSGRSSGTIGSVLVVLQFLALTIIVAHVLPALRSWPSALVIVGAIGLMGWALVSMGKVTFRFHPDPHELGTLQTRGVYRWIRHPMYTAAITASLAVLWKNPEVVVVASVGVVIVVLYCKMCIEESALREKFPEYVAYAARVPALVPFVQPLLRHLFGQR